MKKIKLLAKFPSELRLDVVSGDWVVIATGRAKRPETFKKERRQTEEVLQQDCPFCNIETQTKPVLIFSHGKIWPVEQIPKEWTSVVIPNKYPAFSPYPDLQRRKEGPFYQKMNAVGFHEVVVTRDHRRSLGNFKIEQIKEVIDIYQLRYLDLMKKPFVNYVSIFHNHGQEAGASIVHPHSQIITTPLIDIDLKRSLAGSERYYESKGKCIYCEMNKWEAKDGERIIFDNQDFMVVCPFASKAAFEIIISPKAHKPYFERITEQEKWNLAESFKVALAKLYKGLSDPAYNFYLHTAPCDGKAYDYYHWHWTILPKTATWAGFEIGTRMEISTIEPEKAAEYLKKQ